MKALLGTIAWILCTMLVILPILAKPKPPPPPPKPVKYPMRSWKIEINKAATYTTLITSLRSELDTLKVCGIPSTARKPALPKAFILVELTSLTNKKVTLAFRQSNVYYVGYMDVLNGKTRANFVKEDFKELEKSDLFKNAHSKSQLPHGGGYDDLERVAKTTREKLQLGVNSLSPLLDTISGADYNGKIKPDNIGEDLAKFALVAIQMIPEAARFKYIQDKVRTLGTNKAMFIPDTTFLKLEKNWGKVSDRIHAVSATDRNCDKSNVQIPVPEFPEFKDIKPIVGLLKYK